MCPKKSKRTLFLDTLTVPSNEEKFLNGFLVILKKALNAVQFVKVYVN